jgi:hypothetical protein
VEREREGERERESMRTDEVEVVVFDAIKALLRRSSIKALVRLHEGSMKRPG